MLSKEEKARFDRQIILEEINEEGQEKIKDTSVFIAGAGGLGSVISIYLAAAGIGRMCIVDQDVVEASNLNRQVLHWEKDIGIKKVFSASEKLKQLNSHTQIDIIDGIITEKNAKALAAGFDLIVDALDNMPTRYILNRAAISLKIPFFHGAVHGFEGRTMTVIPGISACLRCLYRGPVQKEKFPVIGVAPALIGIIQATEVIKYILKTGKLLTNRLLIYDGLKMSFSEFNIMKNPNCDHCGAKEPSS
jgi:adenylyltransferase/sulfurtransferase